MSQRYNERHYVWLRRALVVLVLVKGWAWIGIFPVWKVADEPAHFDNIQYRAERGQAPRPTGAKIEAVMGPGVSAELHRSWEVTQHYWRSDFLPGVRSVPEEGELAELARHDDARLSDGQMPAMSYPALYYELGLVPYRLFAHSSIVTRAFAVRTLSLLFGVLAVLCTFAAARRVVDDPWLAFAAALLVALHPVESQQTAAINNDAALVGIGALLFYLQIRMLAAWPDAESWRVYALFGACAGLALLAKPQALALMPGCAVVVAVGAWGRWRARATLVRLGAAAAAFAPLAVVAAIQLSASARAWATVNQATRPHLDAPLHRGFVGWLLHFDPRFSRFLFRTFWGQFGWIEFGFAREWFDWLAHFMLAFALALVRRDRLARHRPRRSVVDPTRPRLLARYDRRRLHLHALRRVPLAGAGRRPLGHPGAQLPDRAAAAGDRHRRGVRRARARAPARRDGRAPRRWRGAACTSARS